MNNWLNLQQYFTVIKQNIISIILFVVSIFIFTFLIGSLFPKKYKATSIIVAANPQLTDKARFFNDQIQDLYSPYGSGDDLDRLYGTIQLDTVLKQAIKQYNLTSYYNVEATDSLDVERKTILALRDDIKVQKTDISQLKIELWLKDALLSANVCNYLVQATQSLQQAIWKKNYEQSLMHLNALLDSTQTAYNLLMENFKGNQLEKAKFLAEQINTYQKTIEEFKLATKDVAPALFVLEKAYPASNADKPKKILMSIAAAIFAFFFISFIHLGRSKK